MSKLHPLLAHLALIIAVVLDNFRRQEAGATALFFSLAGFATFVCALFYFARQPSMFFFRDSGQMRSGLSKLGTGGRLAAWATGVIFPVVWLLSVIELQSTLAANLGLRLVGAYLAFAWAAAIATLSSRTEEESS